MQKILAGILLMAGLMSVAVAGPAVEAVRFQRQPNWNALHMDGRLGDPFWGKTKPLGAFTVHGEPGRTTDDTRVKITFDDKWLYFGVECANLEPGFDRNAVQMRDGAVCNDDSVEIFISSDPARRNYCHFMLNCDNVKAEQKAAGSGSASQRERSWNPVWLSSAAKHERGWTAEIAIPLELLSEQDKVGPLSFNITRTKLIPEFDSQGVRLGEKRESSALFPVRNTFHEPEAFGELRGLEGLAAQPGCRLKLDDVKVESFYVTDAGTFYDVFAKISCGGANGEYADVAVRDLPAGGAPVEVAETRQGVAPGRQSNIKLSVPVAAMGRRDAVVILRDYFTKGTVEQAALTGLEQLTPLDAYFDRNYYTAEQHAGLVCRVTLPAATLAGAQAVLRDAASNELFRAERVAGENLFQVELGRLPPGESALELALEDRAGQALFQKALRLTKRAPKPGHEWKINQQHGILLKDGQPFFPVGIFAASTPGLMRAAKAAGVNVYADWYAAEHLPEYLALAAELDLYLLHIIETTETRKKIAGLSEYLAGDELKQADVLYTANALQSTLNYYSIPAFKKLTRAQRNAIFESFYQASLPEYLAGIRALQDHPNLLVYETFDEPGFAGFDMFVQGRDLYKKTNETDGYHPTMALYSSHIPPGAEATDWCDILCTDPYWIPDGTLKDRSTVNFVSKIVRQTRQRADAARKMTWITLMSSNWSATHRRLPTPAEQMCQSYLAVIHGARGLGYYRYPQHILLVDAIRTFIEQLNALAPALLAPPVPQEIAYSPVEFVPEKDLFPAVHAALFRYPTGAAVLLAANTIERQVTVDFTISGLAASGVVQRMFTNGTCAVSGGMFSDSVEPFGVRAYDLGAGLQLDGPVKILVRSAPDESVPRLPERLPTVDYFGRKGMKNVAPNPSFEEATLPGLPDYLIPAGNAVIGYENSNMTLVDKDPYHGRVCLQLINRKDDGPLTYTGFLVASAPQHPQPETYTWSIYMKGDTDGLPVLFGSHWMKEWDGNKWVAAWKTVKVTREWQRYTVTGPIPAHVSRHCGLELQLRGHGAVWVDAMQLEQGSAPTEFEP